MKDLQVTGGWGRGGGAFIGARVSSIPVGCNCGYGYVICAVWVLNLVVGSFVCVLCRWLPL